MDDDTHHEPIELNTNDFPVDCTTASIYKYTINFSLSDITVKEKKLLAEKFVARVKLNRKNSNFVHNNKFEFFFPTLQTELESMFFQVVCFARI